MIHFRGWGCLALCVPIAVWIAIAIATVAAPNFQPDPARGGALVYRTAAAGFALGAAMIWIAARYRSHVAARADDLAGIPLRFWPWIWGVLSVAALIASFSPAAVRFLAEHPASP